VLTAAGLAACAPPAPPEPEGLSPEQCARFLTITEEYLFPYLEDDWQLVARNPAGTAASIDRVIGDLDEAAMQLSTPETEAAVQRVRDGYTDVRRLIADFVTGEQFLRDAADVAEREAKLDAVEASLADCGDVGRELPTPSPTDEE
jgi:hypothetical protein